MKGCTSVPVKSMEVHGCPMRHKGLDASGMQLYRARTARRGKLALSPAAVHGSVHSLALVGASAPNRLWCCARLVPAKYHRPRTGTRLSMYSLSLARCTNSESTKKESESKDRTDGEMVA